MLQGALMIAMFAVAYGVVYLIYGKAGMELRQKKGKKNGGIVAGIALLLIFWLMSLMFWVGGITAGDTLLCIVITFAVPIIILVISLVVRKKVKAELNAQDQQPNDSESNPL